jgi:hypothetical protein
MKKILIILFILLLSCFQKDENKHKSAEIFYNKNSREIYKKTFTIVIPGGIAIYLLKEKKPHLIKVIRPNLKVIYDAQIDEDGFLWIAAPRDKYRKFNNKIFVIDPSSEKISKEIILPENLSRPNSLLIDGDHVYFGAARNGLSGGFGRIHKKNYKLEFLADLDGPIGIESIKKINNYLLIQGGAGGKKEGIFLYKFDISSKKIEKIKENFPELLTVDNNMIFSYKFSGQSELSKINIENFKKVESFRINKYSAIAQNNDFLFLAERKKSKIDVFSKKFEFQYSIDIRSYKQSGFYTDYAFGFVSDNILMINAASFYDIKSEKFFPHYFKIDGVLCQNLKFAESFKEK